MREQARQVRNAHMGLCVCVCARVFWTCAFGDFCILFLVGQLEKMRERLSVFFYWFFSLGNP
jgi:hypothetical protein